MGRSASCTDSLVTGTACLFARGGRLSLSSWRAIAVSLYKRRRRQDAAALLDHGLSKLFAQTPMHDRARAADYAMGA
jgi:hypothetical protein